MSEIEKFRELVKELLVIESRDHPILSEFLNANNMKVGDLYEISEIKTENFDNMTHWKYEVSPEIKNLIRTRIKYVSKNYFELS